MKETVTLVIADDEVHILRVLDLKLSGSGFHCVKACNGLEAWEKVRQTRPALVISDYQMPGLSGLVLAERMYEDVELRGIPIILLTARGFSLTPDDLEHTNIQYRMSKPFSPRELLALVEDILAGSVKGA
jgi:two-component system, OmpR family, response regulator